MSAAKIAITIDEDLVKRIDLLVKQKAFPNRSKAIEEAVEEKLRKIDRGRLLRECNKLDPLMNRLWLKKVCLRRSMNGQNIER